MKRTKKYIAGIIAIILILGTGSVYVEAQSSDAVAQRERELQAELDAVLKDIAQQQKILDTKKAEASSYERELAILNAEIQKAQLSLRAHNIAIEGLGRTINQKTETIKDLEGKIDKNKESLARLVVKTNELDAYSLVEVALANATISTFFEDVDSFTSIKYSMRDTFTNLRDTKEHTELEKDSLLRKQLEEVEKRISVESEKRKIEIAEADKKRLLSLTKQEQANYQNIINQKEQRAAQIRSALFALRDTAAIPFGKALEYANKSSKITGVRPAFILGILKQESDLGKNTGACLVKDVATGDGVGANTGTPFSGIMKPDRDVQPFLTITKELGRDPFSTRVSCPQPGGYGGAMGPSQFIPSTWMMYKTRLASMLGVPLADPWNAEHAIMATAVYLMDLGAGAGTFAAEQEAAGRYYAGSGWATRGLGYAASVAAHAQNIQDTMIDPLQGV